MEQSCYRNLSKQSTQLTVYTLIELVGSRRNELFLNTLSCIQVLSLHILVQATIKTRTYISIIPFFQTSMFSKTRHSLESVFFVYLYGQAGSDLFT